MTFRIVGNAGERPMNVKGSPLRQAAGTLENLPAVSFYHNAEEETSNLHIVDYLRCYVNTPWSNFNFMYCDLFN